MSERLYWEGLPCEPATPFHVTYSPQPHHDCNDVHFHTGHFHGHAAYSRWSFLHIINVRAFRYAPLDLEKVQAIGGRHHGWIIHTGIGNVSIWLVHRYWKHVESSLVLVQTFDKDSRPQHAQRQATMDCG